MNARAVSLMALLMSQPTVLSEPCQDTGEVVEPEAPWKVRLYGANKDRRAARKKRAKKLGRRR